MHRNAYVLFLIGFLDHFAVSMSIPLLINHCKNLGATPVLAGLVGSTYGFIQFFSGPYMGKCSDEYGRKYVLQICFFFCALSYFVLSISTSIFFVFLSRIPVGMFKHTQELAKSFLAVSVKREERSALLGRFNAISNMGFIVGPVVGGHLTELSTGFYLVAALTSSVFVLNLVLITILLDDDKPAGSEKRTCSKFSIILQCLTLRFLRQVWKVLLIRFLMSFAVFIQDYDPTSTHPAHTAGLIMTFSEVVSTFAGFLVGPIIMWYRNDRRLLLHMSCIQGISIAILTIFTDPFLQMLVHIPYGIVNSVTRVAATNMTLDMAKKKDIGLVMGLGSSTVSIGRFLAPLIGGASQEISVLGPGLIGTCSSFVCMLVVVATISDRNTKTR